MTRRERLEHKLNKRQKWAASRMDKAAGLIRQNKPFEGDIAFATQPGYIPERARAIRRQDKSWEHYKMARHHESKADGLRRKLDRTVFSDDPDAIERLEARIAELEADRERIKRINAVVRRKPKNQATPEKIAALQELGLPEPEAVSLFAPDDFGRYGIASYVTRNISSEIRRNRQRIEEIQRAQKLQAETEAAGGVLIQEVELPPPQSAWCSVRFAEAPPREIRQALREAGFHYSGGQWGGYAHKLPACVRELASGQSGSTG